MPGPNDPLALENDPLAASGKKGALLSFLDWIDRPGQIVRNTLHGNLGGALRQGADFVGDAVDAVLPFDMIPQASRPEDYISGGDLVGLHEPGIGKTIADVGVGLLTDPLTYLTFGASGAAKAAATTGAKAALEAGEAGSRALSTVVKSGAEDGLRSAELAAKAKPLDGGFRFRVPFTDISTPTYLAGHDVDPLSLVGKLGDSAYGMLPESAQETASNIGAGARRLFGAERLSDSTKDLLSRAGGSRYSVTKSGLDETKRILGALPENEQSIVGDVIDNYRWQDGKLVGELDATGNARAVERVALHPDVTPENADRIREAVYQLVGSGDESGYMQRQVREALDRNIMHRTKGSPDAGGDLASAGARPANPEEGLIPTDIPVDTVGHTGPKIGMRQRPDGTWIEDDGVGDFMSEYLPRSFGGVKNEGTDIEQALRGSKPVAGRKLKDFESTQQYLGENPGVTYERSALKRVSQRAEQQGRMAGQAEIGREFGGEGFSLADKDAVKSVRQSIGEMLPPEEARVVLDQFDGLAKRGAVMDVLAKANRYMKPYMVYGAVLPKMGSVLRNRISGIWQVLSNEEARQTPGVLGGMVKRLGSDMADSVTQALGLKNLKVGELTDVLDQVDAAFASSGGVAKAALSKMPKEVAEAVQRGVLDGFVSSEDLLKELARSDWRKVQSIVDFPGKIFRGTEDRMRLGMYLDLVKGGKTADDAAQIVKHTLYDYKVSTTTNRTARDLIPFWQFTAKAVPQQAKFLSRQPAAGVGLAGLYGNDPNEPVYPWLAERASFGIGKNDAGQPMYVSGLGLPVEALNQIPNPFSANSLLDFGRDIERTTVASSQPLLKSAYEVVTNRDPYFGTDAGSYDQIPGFGSQGKLGRLYNMAADTGALAPIDAPLRLIHDATDTTKTPAARALNVLTGANVVTVDPDKAIQQNLTQYLERNPDVSSSRTLYSRSHDPETEKIIAHLKAVKARLRESRKTENTGGL